MDQEFGISLVGFVFQQKGLLNSCSCFNIFQVAFPGQHLLIFLEECLEWDGVCLEWQECLGSMKLLVIRRFLRTCRF